MESFFKYLPLTIFIGFSLKLGLIGATLTDVLAFGIVAFIARYFHRESQHEEIARIDEQFNNLLNEVERLNKELKETKDKASANALINGLKK